MRTTCWLVCSLGLVLASGPVWGQDTPKPSDPEEIQRQKQEAADAARAAAIRLRKLQPSRQAYRSEEALEHLTGLYGDPEAKKGKKYLYVAASCDGRLVTGPMWVDLSPWWMQTLSETEFSYSDRYTTFKLDFILDENGEVVEMIHNLENLVSPAHRMEPLPATWGGCIQP